MKNTLQVSHLINLTSLDFIIIIIYFLALFIIGFIASKKHFFGFQTDNNGNNISNEDNYILAGRTLTLPLFVATLVSTWYGSILGVGEYVYNSGIVAWLSLGLPYYIAAFLYALFFSQKVREFNIHTIPEQIEKNYGRKSALLTSVLVFLMTLPGSYMLMLGLLIELIFNINFYFALFIGSLISVSFIYKGGFKSDVYLNVFQFILMFSGFITLFIYAYNYFGSPIKLYYSLPTSHQSLTGNLPTQVIIVWFIIAAQTFIDPSFHQRCSAAKESKVAKNGILISILCWICFDFLTLSCGLYAFKLLNLQALSISPTNSYPLLAELLLPQALKGLFFVSLLATIMSTLESYTLLSAVTLGRDILAKLNLKILNQYDNQSLIKIGFLITIVMSVALSIFIPSVIQIMYKSSSIALPGLLIPILLSYTQLKLCDKDAIILITIPSLLSALVMLGKYYQWFENIEAMVLGIISSLLILIYYKLQGRIFIDIKISNNNHLT